MKARREWNGVEEASGSSGRSDSLRDGDSSGEEGGFSSALGWPFQCPRHQHDSPKAQSLKFDSYATTLRVSGGVCVFVLRRCSVHWSAAVRAPRSSGSASWSWRGTGIAVRQVSELATRFLSPFHHRFQSAVCAAEVQRLQERVRKLQADAEDEGRRRAQVDTLQQKVANLEGELQAAQRKCDQVNKYTHTHTLTGADQKRFARGRFSQLLSLRLSKRETPY